MFDGKQIDFIIIILYLLVIILLGVITGGKQKNAKEYFLGAEKVPWWAVCFSIVAAETSTLTFISIPGLAYLANLNFLQITFGYFLGRIIVAVYFLPAYYKHELNTAYTFLENRFGGKVRSFASVVFLFTRTAADGVRLFATAIPLYLLLDINPVYAIILMAVVSLLYTYVGGVKGIIWVDAVQMLIYIGGALLAIIYLSNMLPDGLLASLKEQSSKLSVINFGFENGISDFFSKPYTFFGGLIGGAFLSMASHGTDQLIVQRLLATGSFEKSRKALIGSGIVIIMQFALFLILGVLLYSFYGPMNVKADEIFPRFIINQLPSGVSGIIIAGLFAAAISTLAGSMSSLSSSTLHDLVLPFKKNKPGESEVLKLSRLITIVWGVLLVFSAVLFMNSSQAVVELALSIASFTYGGMLGTFLLGMISKKVNQMHALIAFSSGIVGMTLVILFKIVAWTWFTPIGVVITLTAGLLSGKIFKVKEK
jgi:solute:Na+ symporter, SSS family